MGLKGQSKGTGNFERTLFPEGTYDMVLDKAIVMMGKATSKDPIPKPKIMFIWKWNDDAGDEFELSCDYLGFPKNMKWNENSKFWKRVGEIAGLTFNDDNAGALDLDLGTFIGSYDELVEHISGMNDQGKPEKAEVKSLTVNGQEMMGVMRRLVVGVWNNGERDGNEIAKVMQIATVASGPKKAARPAAPQPALVSAGAPAPRPSTTEPAHAELPY